MAEAKGHGAPDIGVETGLIRWRLLHGGHPGKGLNSVFFYEPELGGRHLDIGVVARDNQKVGRLHAAVFVIHRQSPFLFHIVLESPMALEPYPGAFSFYVGHDLLCRLALGVGKGVIGSGHGQACHGRQTDGQRQLFPALRRSPGEQLDAAHDQDGHCRGQGKDGAGIGGPVQIGGEYECSHHPAEQQHCPAVLMAGKIGQGEKQNKDSGADRQAHLHKS